MKFLQLRALLVEFCSVNIDFGKALNLLDDALEQLTQLRDNPQSVIDAVEKDFAEIEWKEKRTRRRRRMTGELAEDEPATSAEDKWRREVFYVAVDSVSTGITNRFSSSRHVFEAFAIFSPKAFPMFLEIYPTTVQVKENVIKFCETYKIDPDRCAVELLSFATVFKHFNLNLVERKSTDFDISDEEYSNSDSSEEEDEIAEKCEDKRYQLVDAYPTLVHAYSIAMAIPITSCSVERSFSTLKRVKTRLRFSMVQDRLEGLMLMSIERNILLNLDREKLINLLGESSSELRKLLL